MRSQLETDIILGLRFWRPTAILVSNLKSLKTKLVVGLRYRDRNPGPVSDRDQQNFGLQNDSIFEKTLIFSDTEIHNWSRIKIGYQRVRLRPKFGFGLHLRPIIYSVSNHKLFFNFRRTDLETKWKRWSPLETN